MRTLRLFVTLLVLSACKTTEPDERARFTEDFSGSYRLRFTLFVRTSCGPECSADTLACRVFDTEMTVGAPARSTVQGSGFDAWSIALSLSNSSTTAVEYDDRQRTHGCSGKPISCWTAIPPRQLNEQLTELRISGMQNTPRQAIIQYPSSGPAWWQLKSMSLVTYDSTSHWVIEVARM